MKTSARPNYRPFGIFRFGLAMMVLLQHDLLTLPAARRDIFYTLELGAVAVTVFFALSGFIVAEATHTFYAGRPAAFLLNRILRIVPPYVAALALAIGVDGWLASDHRLVPLDAPLTISPLQTRMILAGLMAIVPGMMTRAISGQDFAFIPFAWTLRIEIAFYLATFITIWLGGMPVAAWSRRITALVVLAAWIGFAVFAWRNGAAGAASTARAPLCIPFFLLGVCAYQIQRHVNLFGVLHLAFAFGASMLAFTYWGQRGHPSLALQMPLLGALFSLLLLLAGQRAVPPVLGPWDRRLGELSYPLYVSHGIVLTLAISLFRSRGWVLYVASVTAAVGLAALLHLGVERHLRRLRNRVRGIAL